ncbi:MAG: alanine--tRNA ligase [Candidatus Omnitrophica bacterium]|nr:alanine--tRNA ligase [Candidatus Omnitrophota bacterium]
MMSADQIRQSFLNFFVSKQHTHVESDSLVPKDDPTVLFTTAGMQQFKKQFLGYSADYTRATTSQKCMRTDDLDEVGVTDFHHTFFEMLGNFSFGDYFKKEAITWAWEYLTKVLKIDENRLWVSVYHEDSEAESIWKNEIKINPKKIFKLGGKSNFWPSNAKENGPNGPCGPCSEIFYDYHPELGGFPSDPDHDKGRFCEVWNLVFTQFNRKDGGILEPLPGKNIDTGMGLERLTAVLQGKINNFETDIFAPILKAIDEHIHFESTESSKRNERYVMADHIRAIVMGIGDGVIPSNKERGSVIRRLITEITDIAVRTTGKFEPVIYKLVPSVIKTMKNGYPDIESKATMITDNILSVEKAFLKVREVRIPEFEKIVAENQSSADHLGADIFNFKDTYGLTLSTMISVLEKKGVSKSVVEKALVAYRLHMKKQQDQSRASSKMTGDVFAGSDLQLDLPKTDFLGYHHAQSTSSILKIFKGSDRVNVAQKGDAIKVILDKSPFYAESGGQIGDSGIITLGDASIRISDTQKMEDIFIHYGNIEQGSFKTDDVVTALIDIDRRLSIMRNHTATHLLQSAMREILGEHIKQQGSLVAEDRLRFDFSHPKAISEKELSDIENMVNLFVRACDQVTTEYLPIEEARSRGALAFFAEKYGKTVRIVSIGNYSKEFCGGTHLGSTGQIGVFKIIQESAIAQGIRRIEAATGISALKRINQNAQQLKQIADLFKVPTEEVLSKVENQNRKIKEMEKDFETLKFESIKAMIVPELDKIKVTNGISIYKNVFNNIEMSVLKKITDFIQQKLPASVIILGAKSNDSASVVISSSTQAINQGFKADALIKQAAEIIDGRGGGQPKLAQAGGKNPQKLDEAINKIYDQMLKGTPA